MHVWTYSVQLLYWRIIKIDTEVELNHVEQNMIEAIIAKSNKLMPLGRYPKIPNIIFQNHSEKSTYTQNKKDTN